MKPSRNFLTRNLVLLAAMWSLLLAGSLWWNLGRDENRIWDTVYAEARANLNKDISFRRWATSHGGVYVPVTNTQKSGPYLDHVPGHEVTTTSGQALTLLNPATMLRQLMDRHAQDYGVRGRITGLKYLNPDNAPDDWERMQLEAFSLDEKQEAWQIADIDGKPHLRYLRAMHMERGCEKCHAGYKLGDVRGATGVNLPLDLYYRQITESRFSLGLSHGVIWLLGLAGLGWTGWQVRQRDIERNRADASLRGSEIFLRGIFDNAAEGIWVIDTDRRTLRVNEAMARMLGISEAELQGMSIYTFVDEDNAAIFKDSSSKTQESGIGNKYEIQLTNGDGQVIDCLFNSSPLRDAQGKIIGSFALVSDITERKQAETHLRNTKEMLQAAIGAGKVFPWVWEVTTDRLEWGVSPAGLTGPVPTGVSGVKDFREFVHPEDLGTFLATGRSVLANGGPYACEFRIVTTEGITRWVGARGESVMGENGQVVRLFGASRDITERKQAYARLELSASVFTHAREGILITDEESRIIEVNDSFTRITGYSRDEALGQTPRLLQSGRQPPEVYAALWQSLNESGHWSGELWNQRKNGEIYAELLTISTVRNAAGKALNYVALFTDITPMKEQQRQLEHIAHYDMLTALPNRVLLADRLQQAMAQSLRRNRALAVAYLDLDGFKPINDTHGHNVGDELLISVSHRMKEALRDGDTLARMGGDEFVAVLVDLEGPQDCEPVLDRLLRATAESVKLGDLTLGVSASIGVTLYPQDAADADQLIRHADQSMYLAKQAGKNRYHMFDIAHDAAMTTRHASRERIQLALVRHEFILHYQPKVNMRTGAVIGAEALIRWQHPEQGLLYPASFLPTIEDHSLSVELGEWVINEALTQVETWQAQGLDIAVSVNVGARQLQQDNFAERLSALLAAHPGVKPGQLELEILETSALEDVAQVSELMRDCHALGVSFSLDDFGTGYSSLTYLKRLPAELLKIDQSFVRDMLEDPDDLAIVEGIIGLATVFGRRVIAEGVETVAHGARLLPLGCDLAQGYGIARPMPAAQMPEWVANWRPDAAWAISDPEEAQENQ